MNGKKTMRDYVERVPGPESLTKLHGEFVVEDHVFLLTVIHTT